MYYRKLVLDNWIHTVYSSSGCN